jgi:hypothetical protein
MNRNETIARIKAALKRRSGKNWSVTGDRGTAWGWLKIDAPPSRRNWIRMPSGKMRKDHPHLKEYMEIPLPPDSTCEFGHISPDERKELADLLKLEYVHTDGVSIPASNDYYQEYIDRAEGRTPSVIGEPYWD